MHLTLSEDVPVDAIRIIKIFGLQSFYCCSCVIIQQEDSKGIITVANSLGKVYVAIPAGEAQDLRKCRLVIKT